MGLVHVFCESALHEMHGLELSIAAEQQAAAPSPPNKDHKLETFKHVRDFTVGESPAAPSPQNSLQNFFVGGIQSYREVNREQIAADCSILKCAVV